MHKQRKGIKYQNGATLLLSILLMSILTILATTAMQASHLSFKNQISRIGVQKNLGGLNTFQNQAVRDIKNFIDARSSKLIAGGLSKELAKGPSEGFDLLEELLEHGETDYATDELISLMSYSRSDFSIEVYIAQAWVNSETKDNQLLQFRAYNDNPLDQGATVDRYLYLQLHCIGKPKSDEPKSTVHIVGDFRFKV